MSNLIPSFGGGDLSPTVGGGLVSGRGSRRLNRALVNLDEQTVMRLASVQNHAIVQNEKQFALGDLTREAIGRHVQLTHYAASQIQGDPYLAKSLEHFLEVGKHGMTEIILDTVRDYCQEGR